DGIRDFHVTGVQTCALPILLNADGRLWQERLGEKMQCIGALRTAQSEAIIKTIAGYHGKEITRGKPVLEGEFPLDGSRFAGQLRSEERRVGQGGGGGWGPAR